MNRITANRIAITSAIAAVLLLCAYATGEQRRSGSPECIAAEQVVASPGVETPPMAESPVEYTPDEPETAALNEEQSKVRDTARDYVRKSYPNTKTDGVFLLGFCAGELYLAGVDTTSGDQRRTIDLLVRRYVRKNGSSYWRAESLTPEQAAQYKTVALRPCEH